MLEKIPVVEVDGVVVSELVLDASRASGAARYCSGAEMIEETVEEQDGARA